MITVLPKGGNAPLPGSQVRVILSWSETDTEHDIDLIGLLITSTGKVRNDSDFVFYNQPRHDSGSVVYEGRPGTLELMSVDTTALPDTIEKVVLAASVSAGTFGGVENLVLEIQDLATGTGRVRFESLDVGCETALILAEIYQRNGIWKLRAIGQGYESGLAALVTHFGVQLEDEEGEQVRGQEQETQLVVQPTPAAPRIPSDPERNLSATPDGAQRHDSQTPASTDRPDRLLAGDTHGWTKHQSDPQVLPIPDSDVPGPAATRFQPVTRVFAPARSGSQVMDGGTAMLRSDQRLCLLRSGSTPDEMWLRISHTGPENAPKPDAGVVGYDVFGAPTGMLSFTDGAGLRGVRAASLQVNSDVAGSAAIQLRLSDVTELTAALVVALTSYLGSDLASCRSLKMMLVDKSGTVLADFETPAQCSTAMLLLSIVRGSDGSWYLTALARPVPGRTLRSVVGAGVWAVTAA